MEPLIYLFAAVGIVVTLIGLAVGFIYWLDRRATKDAG